LSFCSISPPHSPNYNYTNCIFFRRILVLSSIFDQAWKRNKYENQVMVNKCTADPHRISKRSLGHVGLGRHQLNCISHFSLSTFS